MLSDIKEAFNEMVTELDWMDAGTRARAHKKLSAIRPFVGFPEWITDPEKLDKFYDGVSNNSFYLFIYLFFSYFIKSFVKYYSNNSGRSSRRKTPRDFP